jgi:hypothetical protein
MTDISHITLLIIQSVLDPFNAMQQAISRYKFCLHNPSHPYTLLVSSNTVHNWEKFFINNMDRLYSKGYSRRCAILKVISDNEYQHLSPIEGWFVFAGLIILFQMYGDGNHRTASYLYHQQTGLCFPSYEIDYIQYEYNDTKSIDKDIPHLITLMLEIYYKHINESCMTMHYEPTNNHTLGGKV